MYKGISITPEPGSFASGIASPSKLEDLITSGQREVLYPVHQSELQRFLRHDIDIREPAAGEQVGRQVGPVAQNSISALLIRQGRAITYIPAK